MAVKTDFNIYGNTNTNIFEAIETYLDTKGEYVMSMLQYACKKRGGAYIGLISFKNSGAVPDIALTNAIKHVKEIDGEKYIKITNAVIPDKGKVRVSVFNTGDNIPEEKLNKIWNRFYKIDESRNRDDGGTGIGLALVKAIMNNYGKEYGVVNKENGVEFYFDLELVI